MVWDIVCQVGLSGERRKAMQGEEDGVVHKVDCRQTGTEGCVNSLDDDDMRSCYGQNTDSQSPQPTNYRPLPVFLICMRYIAAGL